MKFSVLVVATAAVLLLVSTPVEGNGNKLKQWVDAAEKGKISSVIREEGLEQGYDQVDVTVDTIFITQKKAIEVTKTSIKDQNYLTIYIGESAFKVDSDLVSSTNYLPWKEDKAMALRLDPSAWGNWFLTPPLSGCDVWIADHDDYEPLVIHINANDLSEQPVENLRYKEKLAIQILNYFNQKYQKQEEKFYQFAQRIFYDYAKDEQAKTAEAVNKYWGRFSDDNIPVSFYHSKSVFFYGFHKSSTWHFMLKDLPSGKLLLNLDCKKSSCNLM